MPGRSLQIALLSHEYPPETGWGGIGTYTYNLATGLSKMGHSIHVVAASHDGRSHRYESEGVSVYRLPLSYKSVLSPNRVIRGLSGIPDMLRHSLMATRCLKQIKARHGLDIIEFPDWRAAGLFCTRGSNRLAPTVCRVHGYLKLMRRIHSARENPNIQCLQWLEGLALSGADLIAPNTGWIAGQLERDYNIPVSMQYVHYMGIDATRFDLLRTQNKRSEIRKLLSIPEASPVILSCGRLEKRKGYEHLIRAVAALRRRGVEAYLVTAGKDVGDEESRLLKIAGECGVTPYLRLAGYVSYDDLPHWYAMCDVYAGASCGESPGLTYQEAMACGRPVVAFRDGAIPEV